MDKGIIPHNIEDIGTVTNSKPLVDDLVAISAISKYHIVYITIG
jgi:hypothetical protein